MFSRFVAILVTAVGLVAATDSLQAAQRVDDGLPERPALIQSVRRQFLARDFVGLEKRASEMRAGARFTDGCWQLSSFYSAFTLSSQAPEDVWEAWLKRFAVGDAAVPGSITARIARAEAWTARLGSREATEVVARVREILETSPSARACPIYFQIMWWVGQAQNWPEEELESVFKAGIALAPDYELFYFRRAGRLRSRPDASPSERPAWVGFAEKAPNLTSSSLGVGMYTRIVWSMLGKSAGGTAMENAKLNSMEPAELKDMQQNANAGNHPLAGTLMALMQSKAPEGALKEYGVDWAKMKQGFQDLERLYPGSLWNKNAFCFSAFCANDHETTARLMTELRDRFTPAVWPSEEYFTQVKAWAETGRLP